MLTDSTYCRISIGSYLNWHDIVKMFVIQRPIAISSSRHQIDKAIIPENVLGRISVTGIHHLGNGFIYSSERDHDSEDGGVWWIW
jgi:hypothetical protein